MATSTHRIALSEGAYTNVSNGNLHCTLVNGENHARLVVSGEEPAFDTPDFAAVGQSGVVSVQDLEAEDDLWARAEFGPMEVTVIRGPAKVTLASG